MVVVSIVAILAALAGPSWDRLIVSNRLRSAVNDWNLSMQFARSEAARQNVPVTLCPSSNGATCTASDYEAGWIVKTQLPAVAGVILQDTLPKQRLTMVPSERNIIFLPNGKPATNFMGTRITVRDDPASVDALSRYICVARTGRARVYTEDQYMALPAAACD
jgi:type IV fimbrial biogenesis protein FimT